MSIISTTVLSSPLQSPVWITHQRSLFGDRTPQEVHHAHSTNA